VVRAYKYLKHEIEVNNYENSLQYKRN